MDMHCRSDGMMPSPHLPFPTEMNQHACYAFNAPCSSPSASSPEVVTPHVDVVVCTCQERRTDPHYEEEAAEATPLSASVVNMQTAPSPPPALPPLGRMMLAPATPPPAYVAVPLPDIPGQPAAYDPLIHSSYSLASSSVTVNQLARVAAGGALCVSADLLTTSTTGPVCRICHLPSEENKQLISPCRCSGTLQFIHNACLVKWLEISMKKYRQRVPRCELCNFEYIRRKRFRFRGWRCPSVSRRDRVLHFIFLVSLLIMLACAVITIQLFMAEKESQKKLANHGTDGDDLGRKSPRPGRQKPEADNPRVTNNNGGRVGGMPGGPGAGGQAARMTLSWEEAVTLGCGVTFFVAFFMAMTAQIKARRTVYQLITKCFASNLIWEIQEYVPEHDKSLQKRRAAASAAARAAASSRQFHAAEKRFQYQPQFVGLPNSPSDIV